LVDLPRTRQLDLIIKVRKNMKPVQHTRFDQALLKRRSLIETVFVEKLLPGRAYTSPLACQLHRQSDARHCRLLPHAE
jgi:hypothetical protein